jgi:hypothetical protein
MKSDLIITRFKTSPMIGTSTSTEQKTFIGSKMVDIEDEIIIDNSTIQYSQMYYNIDDIDILPNYPNNNGYQNYNDIDELEKNYLINLSDVKYDNHVINMMSQSILDKQYNTNWNIIINWQDILSNYLFYKLKNSRSFKCITYNNLLNQNINQYITNYISDNLLNRYSFTTINLYVAYTNLQIDNIDKQPNLQYTPIFNDAIRNDANIIKNVNSTVFDTYISVNYKQTQSSITNTFNYYFDIVMDRI